MVEILHSSPVPPSPTCVTGTSQVSFLQLGSVEAQALERELGKMLGKGALEVVENLGEGYYSHFFLI